MVIISAGDDPAAESLEEQPRREGRVGEADPPARKRTEIAKHHGMTRPATVHDACSPTGSTWLQKTKRLQTTKRHVRWPAPSDAPNVVFVHARQKTKGGGVADPSGRRRRRSMPPLTRMMGT